MMPGPGPGPEHGRERERERDCATRRRHEPTRRQVHAIGGPPRTITWMWLQASPPLDAGRENLRSTPYTTWALVQLSQQRQPEGPTCTPQANSIPRHGGDWPSLSLSLSPPGLRLR